MTYSRQYIYNLRSELYWCQDKLKEIQEGSQDHKELLERIELIKRRLGSDLVPRSLRAQKFQQRLEEENKTIDSQLDQLSQQLDKIEVGVENPSPSPSEEWECPYCGGRGNQEWMDSHPHGISDEIPF